MSSDWKQKPHGAGSLTGIALAFGLLAGCSQTGGVSNTMALQPSLASTETTMLATSSSSEASLPEQTDVFPEAPAYAAASTSESAERLQQVAAVDPAEGGSMASATTDYGPIVANRAQAYAFSSRDHECLARAMYFESNRSSRDGMVAVGSVVMNRVEDGRWGNTVCQVVGAPRQFAPGVMTRSMDSAGASLAMEASRSVLKGERHPRIYDEVMFFHTAGHRFPYDNMHYVAVAGGNSFYEKRRRMRGQPNRSQSAVMAMAQTPLQAAKALASPVKRVLRAPVRAAKKILPISQEIEEVAEPVTVAPIAAPRRPVVDMQPDAARFEPLPMATSGKTGRVTRKPAPQL